MRSEKTTARVVGILFIVATGFAVIGDRLLRPIRDADDYLVDLAGDESRVILGVLSEVTLALAVIAIAALLFPILKRQDEGMAANYVGVRVLEGAIIAVGGLSSLVLLSISQDHSGTETPDGTLEPLGAAFLAVREWTDVLRSDDRLRRERPDPLPLAVSVGDRAPMVVDLGLRGRHAALGRRHPGHVGRERDIDDINRAHPAHRAERDGAGGLAHPPRLRLARPGDADGLRSTTRRVRPVTAGGWSSRGAGR